MVRKTLHIDDEDLHSKIKADAALKGVKLEDWVKDACRLKLGLNGNKHE